MRSSPASVDSSIELPPVTAADLAAGVLVALATGLLGWSSARSDVPVGLALLVVVTGGLLLAVQARSWRQRLLQPTQRLLARGDGSLWLQGAGQAPCRAHVGPGTKLLGPSVFLDLTVDCNPARGRLNTWLTPCDASLPALRRLSVVLLRAGRAVGP